MSRLRLEAGNITAILVSRPGVMQQALRASLIAYSDIIVIASCGDGLSALQHLAAHRPEMLIIDSNLLDEEVAALLATVKASWPRTFCVAIVQTHQREVVVRAAGVDVAVQRDEWSTEFRAALQRLAERPDAPLA